MQDRSLPEFIVFLALHGVARHSAVAIARPVGRMRSLMEGTGIAMAHRDGLLSFVPPPRLTPFVGAGGVRRARSAGEREAPSVWKPRTSWWSRTMGTPA